MDVSKLQNWFAIIKESPEGIRQYLEGTFWIFVFLLLVYAILKILQSKPFLKLYEIIGISAKAIGETGKNVLNETNKSFELPEPYPRIQKILKFIFMLNGYATVFVFMSLFLIFSILSIISDTATFWGRNVGVLFSLVLLFFARFFFAQAERDRISIFKKRKATNTNSGDDT